MPWSPNVVHGARTGAIYTGDCDQLIRVWVPDSVEALKARYDPYFQATDAAVKACKGIPPLERQTWDLFMNGWNEFRIKPSSYGTAGPDAITACGMVRTLDGWRDQRLPQWCNVPGGEPKPQKTPVEELASLVKWGVIGVGGIVLLTTFLPEIRAGLAALRARSAARAASRTAARAPARDPRRHSRKSSRGRSRAG